MKIFTSSLALLLFLVSCGPDKPKSGRSSAIAPKKEAAPVEEENIEADTSLNEADSYYDRERKLVEAEIDNSRAVREEKTVRISGRIRGAAGLSITLDRLGGEERVTPLKTQVINEDGDFDLETTTNQPQIYNLRTIKGNMLVFADGGNYEVDADIDELSKYTVTNAPESYKLREFYLILEEFNKRYDKIKKREDKYSRLKKAWKVSRLLDSMPFYNEQIGSQKSAAIINFADQNKNSLLAALAIERLDYMKHTEYIIETYERLLEQYPYSSYLKNIGQKLVRYRPLAIGEPAPEIILPNVDGENVKLSDFKGKHVLIYFSSNYMQNTIDEAKAIIPVYYQYSSKNFEVFNVAIDETTDDWNAYLQATEAPWITVSDVLGQNSTVFDHYLAPNFPMTYLIDDKGIIVKKYLDAEDLKNELKARL